MILSNFSISEIEIAISYTVKGHRTCGKSPKCKHHNFTQLSIVLIDFEGPDGHPTLFGDVATGLGGEVWKNRTRDGGCHKIYIYTFIYKGLQQPETCAQTYNTHIPAVLTGIAVLCTLGTCLS